VRAIITGGEVDQQLSSETSFQAAGADAVRKAMRDNIILLEPVLRVEVTAPSEFIGPVTSDLTAKRGEIQKLHSRGAVSVLEALVPAAKMFDYADEVRSLSQGRASPSLEPHSYRPAPDEVLHAMLHPEDY
jgi:elongation factor G